MPWIRKREAEELREEVAKARGIPPGVATRDVADIVNAFSQVLRRDAQYSQDGRPFPRPDEWVRAQFPPGSPFAPKPVDRPREDTGQPDPRLFEYPLAWNIQLGTQRFVTWDTLIHASEMPLPRACIELRKTEVSSLDWGFRVSPKAAAKIGQQSGRTKESVAQELRQEYQAEIDKAEAFWAVPDRKNGRNFAEWISMGMDEQLTHDALAIYPRMTYGGDLLDLWVIDGTTIKPLIDETGGRPANPYPAFQQILYGFPRGEQMAQVAELDGQKVVPGAMLASQLIYRRRVPRTRSLYGFSPTEQMLLHGLLYTKRFQWMLAEYTEGAMPPAFMESEVGLDWTPTQLLDYERNLNDRYSGNTAERMRWALLPPGLKAALLAQPGERYRPDYDLHLVKLVAMHYLTTITELGFTESGGLGSTGYHEGQEDINNRKARLPDMRWWGDLITEVTLKYLLKRDIPIEFYFLGLDDEDEAAADELDHNRVADGRMTLNEARQRLNLPVYDFEEADMPLNETARGVVFLQGASKTAPPGVLIEPASEPNDVRDQGQGGTSATQRRPISSGGGTSAAKDVHTDLLAQEELRAYQRWLAKPGERGRNFRCEHLTEELAKSLMPDLNTACIEFAKAGGAAPKAPGQAGNSTLSWSPYTDLR